jgi:hypothetical protein
MIIKQEIMIRDKMLNLVPHVLRARRWRLYTDKGRLVDLWQHGGRAILGHNPPGMLRVLKNSAERGLYAPYPHFANEKFSKALSALLPDRVFRIYESEISLRQALRAANLIVMLWRPFFDEGSQAALQSEDFLVPVLPCPFPGAPAVLALSAQKANAVSEKLPPSQLLSPVILSAATRCIYDLLAVTSRGIPGFSKIDNALKEHKIWKRQGIYLFYTDIIRKQEHTVKELFNNYAVLFQHFLEAGFLLPPSPEEPAILPGELSAGEEAKLAELVGSVKIQTLPGMY